MSRGTAGRRRWGRWVLAAWVALLALSHLHRSRNPRDGAPAPDQRTMPVTTVTGDSVAGPPVRIAYFDSAPPGITDPPVLLLVHGSPGSSREVTGLARVLAGEFRVIAPDLPGFGGSTRAVPDYSIRAHARYLLQVIDSLGIRRAHLLGFSMGGGVIVEMGDRAPDRIASLTMLSAIGVQEFELLGDYHLNHAVHGLQLAFFWLLRNAVPHFGAWDGGMLTYEYARNFYDTDQRPLRAAMLRWQGPMLILQGDRDPLVPAGIAEEHARIVPQAEMRLLEGDHFMAFMRPAELARPIGDFLRRAERGEAVTHASAERTAAALEPFDPKRLPAATGIGFVVLVLLIAAATLVSEDLTCIAVGLLVSRGTIGFLPGTLACFGGIVAGDFLLYFAGRFLGRPALRRRPLRWFVSEGDLARTSAWFARRGPALVLSTRFIPGTRLPTYLAAGVLHTRFPTFAFFFLLSAALWTPLLVGLSWAYGDRILPAFAAWERWSFPLVLAAGLALLIVVELVVPLFSYRGRRLLLSRWRRLTRWEFWPPWAFYPPLVLYILWLALRHRSLTLFTAANPAIPGGGFAGESKWQILSGLRAGSPARLPPTMLLTESSTGGARLQAFESFRAEHGLSWPVVLKPDIGERGSGVALVRSVEEAGRYLASAGGAILAQGYVPGREFGIFYYRIPGEERGRIFSITDKRLPTVTGDGHSTLERLILADERAVCMARFLLDRHAARLFEVPAAGEVVPLVELGTHSRGAAFFDGTALGTPALADAVDEMSRGWPGFWFGRYDVRSPSVEALQAGEFTVIELNGATAEATSIYDPGYGVLEAYRTLARQWRILFEIGARNRAAGVRPATLGELLALLRKHRAAKQAHVNP